MAFPSLAPPPVGKRNELECWGACTQECGSWPTVCRLDHLQILTALSERRRSDRTEIIVEFRTIPIVELPETVLSWRGQPCRSRAGDGESTVSWISITAVRPSPVRIRSRRLVTSCFYTHAPETGSKKLWPGKPGTPGRSSKGPGCNLTSQAGRDRQWTRPGPGSQRSGPASDADQACGAPRRTDL